MTFLSRAFLLLVLLALASRASADSLTTTGGKKIVGKLVAVDVQGVTFNAEGAELKVSGKDLLLVDLGHPIPPPPKDAKYNELELTDGSTFRIGKFTIKGKKLDAELLPGPQGISPPSFDIGLTAVFSLMRGADDPKNRDAWKKVLGSRGKRDLYVIREAEGLNFVPGTILNGNDAGDLLTFEKEDGAKTELRLSRATGGLVFSQPQAAQVAVTLCKVLDVFGNSLVAQAVLVGTDHVTVTTVNGVVVKYNSPDAIAKLDYGQGNVAYLSDLDPQVEAPEADPNEKGLRLNVAAPLTRDQSVGNEPLKLGSEQFPKGITIAPDTKLTFTLGGDYREFKAVAGLQEFATDGNLEAKLIIETDDGRILFSESIKRKDKPKHHRARTSRA